MALEIGEKCVVVEPVDDRPCVFLPCLRHAEDAIAVAVRRLRAGHPPWSAIDADKAIDWVQKRLDVALAPGQKKEAVRRALSLRILIITGGPGVGKTTIIRAILAILKAKGVQPLLAAPTGRAAKQLVVLIGQKKAVGIAVRGVQGRRRWSKLRELLAMDETEFAMRARS